MSNHMAYEGCYQYRNEGIDKYYIQFIEIMSKLNVKSLPTYQILKFTFGLQKEYKKILSQYANMSMFQDVMMAMIFECINRELRMRHDPFSTSEVIVNNVGN